MNNKLIDHNADSLAIGNLVLVFQFLEATLFQIVVDTCLPGEERAIAMLVSQLSFKKLAAAFSTIVGLLSSNDETKRLACTLARQLCEVECERNKFIHSHYDLMAWSFQGQQVLRRKHTVDIKHGYRDDERWFDPVEIDAVITKMGKLGETLFEIRSALTQEKIIPQQDDFPCEE